MHSFSISDIARFTGIKPHTIRRWEERYEIVEPTRIQGSQRIYNTTDLSRLLRIALLSQHGSRISRLTKASDTELTGLEKAASGIPAFQRKSAINKLIIAMYCNEPFAFDEVLNELQLNISLENIVENVLFPFLKITGLLYKGHKLTEEHIVVTTVRRKIILAYESLNFQSSSQPDVIMFLPDSGQLDLGLLYATYLFRKNNIHAYYLGLDVGVTNLVSILRIIKSKYLFTYVSPAHKKFRNSLIEKLALEHPEVMIVFAEYGSDGSELVVGKSMVSLSFDKALHFIISSADHSLTASQPSLMPGDCRMDSP